MLTAKKNARYYLTEQRSECEHWFRCVRSMETYSEVVYITSRMAKELLDARKTRRNLRVVGPSDLKIAGTHHNVAISFSGNLVEGQRILENIIENGKSTEVLVTFNLSDRLVF